MAADTLRSINAILQSGERREQRKVDTALAMMQLAASQESSKARETMALQQFAQNTRMQEIALTQNNLSMAAKSLEMEKPKIASAFGESTGITKYYEQMEEGESAYDAITDMAKALRKKMGKGYDDEANKIAGAVFNYYTAKDSDSMVNMASNLYDAAGAINDKSATASQRKLFEAFKRLGASSDLQGISTLAKKAKVSEANISKEMGEFLQGDYEIQSPIGLYADIPEAVMSIPPPAQTILSPTAGSIDETREALKLSQLKLQSLEKKMSTGVATDEEKEEYYALPSAIKRIRIDLYDESGEFEEEKDNEIKDISSEIAIMEENNLTGLPKYQILKQNLKQKNLDKNAVVNLTKWEVLQEQKERQYQEISDKTGIPTDEIEREIKRKEQAESFYRTQSMMMR